MNESFLPQTNMDYAEYTQVKAQLDVLKEVAETYRGRTVENVIDNLEARIKHYIVGLRKKIFLE